MRGQTGVSNSGMLRNLEGREALERQGRDTETNDFGCPPSLLCSYVNFYGPECWVAHGPLITTSQNIPRK